MGWRKRSRRYDSSSGVGSVVGVKTGKILDYATRNTMCRVCSLAEKNKQEPRQHDCRRNHQGSSKSMESNVAVQLFLDAGKSGLSYSTYVGDDDSTTESSLKTLVDKDIEKWSDINHSCRSLGTRLYSAKNKVKGLTPTIIAYIQKCFTYCVRQNKNDPEALLKAMHAIIPHAFGDHEHCSISWCKYRKDPAAYKHNDLPGGKDLVGSDLRACIEDCFRPFLTKEAAAKLAPGGSSQSNESLNNVIASKAPKVKHYGDSESSDFRTAAGVAQFNEGHTYLAEAAELMSVASNTTTRKHIKAAKRKRDQDSKRKAKRQFKVARRHRQKKKTSKTSSLEKHEGVSYETGIGLNLDNNNITNGTIINLKQSISQQEFITYTDKFQSSNIIEENLTNMPVRGDNEMQSQCFVFDIETTGLGPHAEIIQIACSSVVERDNSFASYVIPTTSCMAESATKVHGISIEYKNGAKALVKNGEVLPAASEDAAFEDFCNFMINQTDTSSSSVFVIAHNGDKFDFPILLKTLQRLHLFDKFTSCNVYFLDSLKIITDETKRKDSPLKGLRKKSLSSCYEFLFQENFEAHDAKKDVEALIRILFQSSLKLAVNSLVQSAVSSVVFMGIVDSAAEAKARRSTLQGLPVSDGIKTKIAQSGLDMRTMKQIFQSEGCRGLLAVLALPTDFDKVSDKAAKPRVTKDSKVLTNIVKHFQK